MEPPSIFFAAFQVFIACCLYWFFTLATTSLKRARRTVLEETNEPEKSDQSEQALILLGNAEYYLLVCIFCHFLTVATTGMLALKLSSGVVGLHFVHTSIAFQFVVSAIVVVVVALFALIVAQLVKAFGVTHPEAGLHFCVIPLRLIGFVTSPLLVLLQSTSRPLLRWTGLQRALERTVARSAEEISEIVAQSNEAGNIEDDEEELFQGVVRFSGTRVHEVMTPRKDVVSVRYDATLEEVVWLLKEEGFSRVLVTGEELDEVKGILMAKDLIPLLVTEDRPAGITDYIREHITVPGTLELDELLQRFQREALHFAVVLDEHGGVDGVVTLEDLVEEIVGDIFDEHDSPEEEQEVRTTKTGDLLVDGSTPVDDLNDDYDLDIPEGEYDTIAGFVINLLDRIPDVGELVEHNGLFIRIEEVDHNRIMKLRLQVS